MIKGLYYLHDFESDYLSLRWKINDRCNKLTDLCKNNFY